MTCFAVASAHFFNTNRYVAAKIGRAGGLMKKFLLSTVAIVAVAPSASAADFPAQPYAKVPQMVAAMHDWSGFYIGINGGGGSSRNCWDIIATGGLGPVPPTAEGCHNATGGTAGGQIGYRLQNSAFVFGLEAQGNWADFRGDNASLLDPLYQRNSSQIDAFGLFTGQVGYAIDTVLLYLKGGAAVTSEKFTGYQMPGFIAGDRATETRVGGVVGGGIEYSFLPNWSFAVQYDHMFMGTRDVNLNATGAFLAPAGTLSRVDRIQQSVDMVTARVNYMWGGPVISKY
jgi:outer membrane immunogenic protein